jgi:predicted Fe-Mo cluster-binding NifX family protein
MKIAFTTSGPTMESEIDPRFGRTSYILIYNSESNDFTIFDNRSIDKEAHGAGPKTSQKIFELGAEVLITGNGPGGNAANVLKSASVEIFIGAENMTVKEALDAYQNKRLTEFKL